jgi:hypothetical protein
MAFQDSHERMDAKYFSPEEEREKWEFHLGLLCDRFSGDGQQVNIEKLRNYLQLRLGPLFAEHADQFESVLGTLDCEDATREGIQKLMGKPLTKLRQQSYSDYPTFEMEFRRLNQEQHGLTPITHNRVVSYGIDGRVLNLHIQPSYSAKGIGKTIEDAMRILAAQLKDKAIQSVDRVEISSWLVKEKPERWQELGFKLNADRPKLAHVSVEEFIKRWSG